MRKRWIGFGEHDDQRPVQRDRDGRGGEAAGGGEHEALRHELPHQPAAAGAEREPQRHLGPARGAAREQQVREVRARNQQQRCRRPRAAPSATWPAPSAWTRRRVTRR